MHKFFVPKENVINGKAYINGEDVKHIYKVLRLQNGDKININNCCGEEFLGEIACIDKNHVIVNIIEELGINNESHVDIFLFQGLPKAGKMDLIVQKAVELGIKGIIPILTSRVVIKNELGEFKKVDRWKRIALEACKQCKRSFIPEVSAPMEFETLLNKLKEIDMVVVPYENAEGYGIKAALNGIDRTKIKNVAIVVGPEGGFEEDEIQRMKADGAYIVTLGPRILRTETAGFTAAGILMYELGDMGGVL